MKNQHPNIIIQPIRKAGKFWQNLGPGFITGAADDDPSGITTYAQSGAKFGFNFLWLAPYTFPLMAMVQEMCAKIGMVTGRGLAGNIKKYYPKSFLIFITGLLFLANVFNIGANLAAMAEAVRLVFPRLDFYFLTSGFVILSLLLQIFSSYKTYSQILKWLALFLLAYVFSAFYANLNGKEIFLKGFLPNGEIFSSAGIVLLCAFLGTTISPYLFFWQTSQEVEEEILEGKTTLKARQSPTLPAEIKKMQLDVWVGMFFSNLIAFFIIATTASVLNQNQIFNIQSAGDAALALKPLAGQWSAGLFTVGIVGTGMLSIPVLAGSCSYALAETFGWKNGLYKTLKQAKAFYGTIIIAMLLGFSLNLVGLNPIKALILSAVINGLVAPFILIPIVQISSRPKIMGNYANSRGKQTMGWLIIAIMFAVGLASIISFSL